jgi:chromate transporter
MPRLPALIGYFLRLGTLGFGGPIALCAAMHRDLVERRHWISERDYLDGLALAQLAPGPLAAQLAIYIGWLRGGWMGATAIGVAFVLPSFLMVLAIAAAYVRLGGLPWMQAAFYGIGAAVIAIVLRGAVKLARLTLARDRWLWPILGINTIVTAVTQAEIVWLILAGGVVVAAARDRHVNRTAALAVAGLKLGATFGSTPAVPYGVPSFSSAAVGSATADPATLFWFFTKAGAFVFGSGLAIIPFLYGGVVEEHGWLTERQFVDAVAVAMITPGPVVITVAFIGFLVGGFTGATVAAAGVFVPCWLFVIVPAPHFARLSAEPRLKAFIDGVTAGAAGAILGAVFVLARRAIVDLPTLMIFAATLAALVTMKRIPEPVWIALVGIGAVVLAR